MFDKNDHRKIGLKQKLFHFQEEAAGMVFWHPKGLILSQLLEQYLRDFLRQDKYQEVKTPQLFRQSIWDTSGHWQHYTEHMFCLNDGGFAQAIKPVNCPAHIQFVLRQSPSYRDLPLRLCEFGACHRKEPSGALYGLFRLRQFTQDDGHIFCEKEQLEQEVVFFCHRIKLLYQFLGFQELSIAFSSRPKNRIGDDSLWDQAEDVLLSSLKKAGLSYEENSGEGAFYGPKIEFLLRDYRDRLWQCGTIQADFVLPERFNLFFIDKEGKKQRPVMLHRALVGSLERFLGLLLEHHRGKLPPWLAPEQVRVAPVSESQKTYANEVVASLQNAGIRVALDTRNETLSRRALLAREENIPWFVVVGKREMADGTISLRSANQSVHKMLLEESVNYLQKHCFAPKPFLHKGKKTIF